jgi:hypothetical protein
VTSHIPIIPFIRTWQPENPNNRSCWLKSRSSRLAQPHDQPDQ